MTYRETVNLGEKVLSMADIAEAKTDAWLLLEMVCKIDRSFYYLHMAEEMPEEQMSEYQIALRKRAEHVPLQYIVGETEFMGLKFKVNSSVLIPRQDTETLVEEALKVVRPGMRVLDLCTGSVFCTMYRMWRGMRLTYPSRRSMLRRKMQGSMMCRCCLNTATCLTM